MAQMMTSGQLLQKKGCFVHLRGGQLRVTAPKPLDIEFLNELDGMPNVDNIFCDVKPKVHAEFAEKKRPFVNEDEVVPTSAESKQSHPKEEAWLRSTQPRLPKEYDAVAAALGATVQKYVDAHNVQITFPKGKSAELRTVTYGSGNRLTVEPRDLEV